MKQSPTAFFTVVYPGAEVYLDHFLASLEAQSCKDFDLVIINDGLVDSRLTLNHSPLNINCIPFKGTIAKIREFGINTLIKLGYKQVIFGDSDDFFATDRVEKCLEVLQHYDIAVNELLSYTNGITGPPQYSTVLKNRQPICKSFLKDKNLCGLSNTAIRLEGMAPLTLPENLIAVDWYIFTCLLNKNKKAAFISETNTFYRQHNNNTVGLNKAHSPETIKQGIEVKLRHYQALTKQIPKHHYYQRNSSYFSGLVKNNKNLLKYIQTTIMESSNTTSHFWWENIKGVE